MYRVQKFEKYLHLFDKDMLYQYKLLKAFTRDFTKESVYARGLDALLSEKMRLIFGDIDGDKDVKGIRKPRAKQKSGSALDERAYQAVKNYLKGYVERGDTLESLRAGWFGVATSLVHFQIRGNFIEVTKLEKEEVNLKLSLPKVYARLRDELGREPDQIKNGKAGKDSNMDEIVAYNQVYRALEPYVGQDYTIKDLQDIGKISNPFITFKIKGDNIYATKLEGDKVNFRFALHALFVRIREDLEMEPVDLTESEKGSRTANKTMPPAKGNPPQNQTVRVGKQDAPATQNISPAMVEKLSEEVRFIKRYALMNGKEKSPEQIRAFANSLRKAILEKRIRKNSPYAEQIIYIQDKLINWCNKVRTAEVVKIDPEVLQEFRDIVATEKIMLSSAYLKRYMNLQGKEIDKEQAERLYTLITKAIDQNKISVSDPYRDRLENALKPLFSFIKSARHSDTLKMHRATLNGIISALDGCPCEEEGEIGCLGKKDGEHAAAPAPHVPQKVISSIEFENLPIETLGLFGKWYDLIGDATPGFIVMIFGKPKLGKTYLAIDLAGFLAFYFGPVLYVTKEEGFSGTFQQKIIEQEAAHPELYIANQIPEDLNPYEFVFFDSATKLNLVPEDIAWYKQLYPGKTFVYVFQATKDGNFRGSQEFEHDVDVIIEVYELGKARQYGRFNQGAEMEIFNEEEEILPIAA